MIQLSLIDLQRDNEFCDTILFFLYFQLAILVVFSRESSTSIVEADMVYSRMQGT